MNNKENPRTEITISEFKEMKRRIINCTDCKRAQKDCPFGSRRIRGYYCPLYDEKADGKT